MRLSTILHAPTLAWTLGLLACEAKREAPDSSRADSSRVPTAAETTSAVSTHASDRKCGGVTITRNGVGDLGLGMTIDSVRAICVVLRDTTRLASEGQTARMITVAFPGDTVEAEVTDGRVWRIEVLSPRFRTSDSLGVGTPLGRLLTLRNPRGLTGEGQLFVASADHCGLSFRLSDNGSNARSQNWDRAGLSRLRAETVVDKILIVGCNPR